MTPPVVYSALEALVDAYHRRLNGRLVFKRDGVERSVILLFRKVVFANSTEKKDRLELLLATRKLMSKEEVLRLAAKAKASNVDFLTIVQREGVLKDVALFDVITDRARDIITDLITWQGVQVEHDLRGFSAESVLPLNTDLFPILLDGLMERFSADDCRKLLGAEDQVPVKQDRQHVLRDIPVSAHSQLIRTVLDRVNGTKAIVDILSGLDPMAGMKILAAMKLLGVVDLPNQHSSVSTPTFSATVPVDHDVVTAAATVDLSSEEKAALSNIFEGATNLLEDDESGNEDLEILVEDEPNEDKPNEDIQEEDKPEEGLSDDETVETSLDDDGEDAIEGLASEGDSDDLPADTGLLEDDEPVSDDPVEAETTTTTPQVQSDFNALLDIDPEEAAKLFSVALELFQRGRIASALKVYLQAIEKDPSNAEYYTSIGMAYLESGAEVQPDEHAAMGAFLEAVKLNPESPKNHYYLGKIYERRGENEPALLYYQEALKRDANYAPAREAVEKLAKGSSQAEGPSFLRKLFGR